MARPRALAVPLCGPGAGRKNGRAIMPGGIQKDAEGEASPAKRDPLLQLGLAIVRQAIYDGAKGNEEALAWLGSPVCELFLECAGFPGDGGQHLAKLVQDGELRLTTGRSLYPYILIEGCKLDANGERIGKK